MTEKVAFLCLLVSLVNCVVSLQCTEGGNCTLSMQNNETTSPKTIPKSLNMLAEDIFQPTVLPSIQNNSSIDEAKGRALNFTMDEHSTSNNLPVNATRDELGDLSDVSINEDDDDDKMPSKIVASKPDNVTIGHCEKGGLTYENGEKLELGCDSICTCINGKMDCNDRCKMPFFRKGKHFIDPLCTAEEAEDPCCSILVCSSDTETEPLEICSYNNKTYNRGEHFSKDCSEFCTCEVAGKVSCKPRCPIVKKTSDRCVEVPDPSDSCCKKILCDVTLDDHEPEKEEMKITSAKFINSTTIVLQFDSKVSNDSLPSVEVSYDKNIWKAHRIKLGNYVKVENKAKYIKLQNSDDILEIQTEKEEKNLSECNYKNATFKLGEEFNDKCASLCVCKESGIKCLKIECPTYFGVDVLDPHCVEWETIPPNFVANPPNCCPEKLQCKSNGSCIYEGNMYSNWEQVPINVTGCDKRCFCEMGKVECQNTCPPVTALPPPTLPCLPHQAGIGHAPHDDCCLYWICNAPGNSSDEKEIHNSTDMPFLDPFNAQTTKAPSKVLGPLVVYENRDKTPVSYPDDTQIPPAFVTPDENPFVHKSKLKDKNEEPYLGPLNPNYKKNQPKPKTPQKSKPSKDGASTPKPDFPHITYPVRDKPQIPQGPTKGSTDELLQFISQHPDIANYPSGSVLEIHNIAHNGVLPPNRPNHQVLPYVIPQGVTHDDSGITLEQFLQEIHKHSQPQIHSNPQYPNGPLLIAPQSGHVLTRFNASRPGNPDLYPDLHQQEEISVHNLEAIDPHTVRLAFMVPPVIVGLHGRVEVRYTHNNDNDINSWKLQVFAPPNDLIATPQLEFDLLGLKADTEYKIKITITLRDLHNTPSSKIYTIKTPKEPVSVPAMIPISPELAITDINATWVTVVWRKFTEYELQFIDGVQLRFKEIDGKIYDATPLIHRLVTSYTLENLKPNTKYEIGIFFIPFPDQLTELKAEHMLHFTTANEVDTYGFNVTLEITHIKSTSVEIAWSGVPYPEDKYVNIYRAIYQSDSGKEDHSTFKIAKRDSPTKTVIMDLKPGTRYRLWLEIYLTNGKIKTSNVQDFITKPRTAPVLGSTQQDKLSAGEHRETKGDYYGPLVIVAILASIAIMSTLILLLILVRRHNQNKASITPPARVSQSAYDNPTYKVEIQQETMGL